MSPSYKLTEMHCVRPMMCLEENAKPDENLIRTLKDSK